MNKLLPNMSGNVCYTTGTTILNQTPCIFFTLTVTTFIVVLKKDPTKINNGFSLLLSKSHVL